MKSLEFFYSMIEQHAVSTKLSTLDLKNIEFCLLCCGCDTSYIVSVYIQCQTSIYTFVVSRAFKAGVANQAGDADSSRTPGLTSGLQGSVNVHRGALLLVPQ